MSLDDLAARRRGARRRSSGSCVRPSARSPLHGEVLQVVGVVGEALGQREARQLGLAELDLDLGPLGDPQRVVARLESTSAKR